MLLHLIGEARARGYAQLSLETGSGGPFEPALGYIANTGSPTADRSQTIPMTRSAPS
ncbi:MAG: hypothetical protein H7241_08180 [Novosphingobium sp.]|nr:hypothetical protein [Novosphingobium sp.]